jgi:RNA polymerase sigma-70 factor (ECF subfamily)
MFASMQEEGGRPTDQYRTRTTLLQHVRDLGNEHKWIEFHDTYSDLIFFAIRKAGLQPAEAEDVTQDIFIELARRMPRFEYDRTQGSFRGWLLRLVSWRIKDRFRNRSSRPGTPGSAGPDDSGAELEQLSDITVERAMEEYWNDAWRKAVVRRALSNIQKTSKLSERHLQILDLLLVRGLKPAEVAKRLEIKRALVDTTYSRSRERLEEEINRLRDEPI